MIRHFTRPRIFLYLISSLVVFTGAIQVGSGFNPDVLAADNVPSIATVSAIRSSRTALSRIAPALTSVNSDLTIRYTDTGEVEIIGSSSSDDAESISADVSVAPYNVNYANHGVPVMSLWLNGVDLDTINNNDKSIKYPGNEVSLSDAGETLLTQSDVEVKGRGNTTWGAPKKPYQIKFSKKQNLLGLGKAKKWVLLANYLDISHLRNDLAFTLGQDIHLAYTPEGRFVDLYVDGKYNGLYFLTAKIEINEAAVNLDNDYAVVVENDSIHTDGTDPTFRSATENSLIWLKDVGKSEVEADAFAQFEAAYNQFERDVYNNDWAAVNRDIDVDSFAKYYLLNEFVANQDANHASYYMYKNGPDDKIHAGPVWDFDLAFCGLGEFYGDPYQLWVYNDRYNKPPVTSKLLTKLMDMPQFRGIVESLYKNVVSDALTHLILSVDNKSVALSEAIIADHQHWDKSSVIKENYTTNTAKLKTWMIRRKAFLDQVFTQRVSSLSSGSLTLKNDAGYVSLVADYPGITPAINTFSSSFVFESLGNGYFSIRNEALGRYLTDTNLEQTTHDADGIWYVGQIAVSGKACTLEDWSGKDGQQWMFFRDANGQYRIINKNSSFFLSSKDGRMVTSRWGEDSHQLFDLENASSLEQRREVFISHLYETCLDREPEREGLDAWMSVIYRGFSGAQIVRGFVYSDEFIHQNLDDEEYVTALYSAIFDREPDSTGLHSWTDYLEQGVTRDKVVDGFVRSLELENICRSIYIERGSHKLTNIRDTNTKVTFFVNRLYRNCLNRKWDEGGLTNWVTILSDGSVSGSSVVYAFFTSDEFLNQHFSNEEFVTRLYRTTLDREPDAPGLANWVRLLEQGRSREKVISGFTNSPEFINLCNSYGVKP